MCRAASACAISAPRTPSISINSESRSICMIKPVIFLIAIAAIAGSAYADTAPTKQELAQKVLQLWHVETIGQSMLQEPVAEAVQQARAMLQSRAPAEKRDAAMRDIAEDAKKF